MKVNLQLTEQEQTNFANRQDVYRVIQQMEWHLQQIKKQDYKISFLDF